VGNTAGTNQVAISSDGGATWNINYGSTTTQYGGSVAYSANADTILWSSTSNGVLRSQYQSTFSAVSSVPSGAVIASDKRNNTAFYAASGSTFYVSTDTGSTFAAGGALTGASSVTDITVHPTTAGEVWVSTNVGLFRSTNYGKAFTAVGQSALSGTQQVAFGLGSGSTWILYAFGVGSAGAKLYASADTGATWTDIQGSQGFGAISSCKLAGSGNTAGQVYVGTNGRGVFYASGSLSGGSGTTTTTTSSTSSTSVKTSTTSSTLTTSTTSKTTTSTTSTISSTTSTTSKTTTSTTSSATSTSTAVAAHYSQCGGIGWGGATTCVSPYTCLYQNDYYSQCL
jgi:xyloglucan-specific exo-beta-1,4-glucanase